MTKVYTFVKITTEEPVFILTGLERTLTYIIQDSDKPIDVALQRMKSHYPYAIAARIEVSTKALFGKINNCSVNGETYEDSLKYTEHSWK